jgi:hypothetical protein
VKQISQRDGTRYKRVELQVVSVRRSGRGLCGRPGGPQFQWPSKACQAPGCAGSRCSTFDLQAKWEFTAWDDDVFTEWGKEMASV